jgi:hypothetical protein
VCVCICIHTYIHTYIYIYTYEGGKKVRPFYYGYNEIYIIHGHTLRKYSDYFPTTFPSLPTHFFHFRMRSCLPIVYNSLLNSRSSLCTLYFSLSSSAKWRPRSASFRWPKKWIWEMLNPDRREDEGEQSTQFLQLTPLCADWCAVWRFPAGVDMIHLVMSGNLRIRCSKFFNVCTHRPELIVAHHSKRKMCVDNEGECWEINSTLQMTCQS